ncbi:MAG TPA: hypothetical protein VF944_04450 [Candidatus Bathyarchaeia archaeon]
MILQYLARKELLTTRMTSFMSPRYPQPVHLQDIKEAFVAVADHAGHDRKDLKFGYSQGIEVYCRERLFEKLFKVIFVNEKLFPKKRSDNVQNPGNGGAPLPTLFIGSEKTQVRQVPLAETRPWPFKFLLELGGMIVCRPSDRRDFVLELRQFLNNHPQFSVKVDAKEWPDGSIAVFTYWFEKLPDREKRKNVNVP